MIDLNYWTTANGHKVTMPLEETGLAYRVVPVNIGTVEQFAPEFLSVSRRADPALGIRRFVAGADYSIAEMASYPWILPEAQGQDMRQSPHLARWHAEIEARPATMRAYAIVQSVNASADGIRTEDERKVPRAHRPPEILIHGFQGFTFDRPQAAKSTAGFRGRTDP